YREIADRWSITETFQHLESTHVREAQINYHAVIRLLRDRGESFGTSGSNRDLDIFVAEEFANAELLGGIVFNDEQALETWRGVFLDAAECGFQPFAGGGLGDERECAARQTVLAIFV